MKARDRDKGNGCPLLRPGGYAGPGRPPVPVYCRLPSGKVRVPTPAELGSLCFVERYRDCPGYRRWARSRQGLAGPRA